MRDKITRRGLQENLKKTSQNKKKTPNIPALSKVADLIDKNKQSLAKKLIKRAEFMEKTLKKLEKQVENEGAVIECVNGNGFKTTMEHPAQKSYNTMIGKYNAVVKTIIDMVPENAEADDELISFIKKRND